MKRNMRGGPLLLHIRQRRRDGVIVLFAPRAESVNSVVFLDKKGRAEAVARAGLSWATEI